MEGSESGRRFSAKKDDLSKLFHPTQNQFMKKKKGKDDLERRRWFQFLCDKLQITSKNRNFRFLGTPGSARGRALIIDVWCCDC